MLSRLRYTFRETFDSSLRTGRSALEALGVHPYDAERQVLGFVINDKEHMRGAAEAYSRGDVLVVDAIGHQENGLGALHFGSCCASSTRELLEEVSLFLTEFNRLNRSSSCCHAA